VKGSATGPKYTYRYLQNLYYDKFEQRAFVEQGNGVKTSYTYDAQNRRLNNLIATSQQGNTRFQNLSYSYDKVGNILRLQNDVALPHANDYGGPSVQQFQYDDLYRLTKGQGVFPANVAVTNPDVSACNGVPSSQCHVYSIDMTYDTIHNIQRKNQLDTRYTPSGSAIVQKKVTYDFPYAYNASGASSVRPHAPNHIDIRTYTYDANGNQLGWTHDTNGTRRNIVWDDENRIQSVADNGATKVYTYDDQGNRAIKRGPQGETVYVNQFYTDRPGANGTKHIYAGTSRIASKLMRQDTPGANPNGKTPFEKDLYFYHPDHLGSSNYITDLNGKLYEHLEYFPFGEGWIEENTNQQRTPYLFSAKELDEETGLYYFGKRYYDPRTSVWQSVDPILNKYLPEAGKQVSLKFHSQPDWQYQFNLPSGGVFVSENLAGYSYVGQHPLRWIDPSGLRALMEKEKLALQKYFGGSLNTNVIDLSATSGSRASQLTGGNIKMPTRNFVDNNPDKELKLGDPYTFSVFAHEALHVWQRQYGRNPLMEGIFPQIGYSLGIYDPYKYDKSITDSDKVLKMFLEGGLERQGQMLQDYVFAAESGQDTSKFSKMIEHIWDRAVQDAKEKAGRSANE
jgi:RHS repeat-associated protein